MDLWIKTQDKCKLIKIDNISVDKVEKELYTRRTDGTYLILGKYKTIERIEEILHQIENILLGDIILFKNIAFDKDIENYIKPNKGLFLIDSNKDEQKVESLNCSSAVYQLPEE